MYTPTDPVQYWFPALIPGSTVIQSFDLTSIPQITQGGLITSLSAQIAPSGTGELSAVAVAVTNTTLSITLYATSISRVYSILFTAMLVDGETVAWTVNQNVAALPPFYTTTPPTNPGYGTGVYWVPTANNVASTALSASLLASAIPRLIANVQMTTTSAPGWLMLLDSASVPGSGTVAPMRWWQIAANTTLPMHTFIPPLVTLTGVVLLFSTTGPFTYTPSATAVFSVELI